MATALNRKVDFVRLSRAYYADAVRKAGGPTAPYDEIHIRVYTPGPVDEFTGIDFEFGIEAHFLNNEPALKVQIFDDAFQVFRYHDFTIFFSALYKLSRPGSPISLDEIEELATLYLSATDATPTAP